jgi:hypothetical protein
MTPMTSDEDDLSLAAFAICYGGAQLEDIHLLADIVAIDGEIVEWLEQRERRRKKRRCRSR